CHQRADDGVVRIGAAHETLRVVSQHQVAAVNRYRVAELIDQDLVGWIKAESIPARAIPTDVSPRIDLVLRVQDDDGNVVGADHAGDCATIGAGEVGRLDPDCGCGPHAVRRVTVLVGWHELMTCIKAALSELRHAVSGRYDKAPRYQRRGADKA